VATCPLVTTTGVVQPEPERSAILNVVVSPARSSQLRIRPRLELVICGDRLLPLDGDDSGCSVRGVVRQSARPHPIAKVIRKAGTMRVTQRFCTDITGVGNAHHGR
jgi:hypothetical protein